MYTYLQFFTMDGILVGKVTISASFREIHFLALVLSVLLIRALPSSCAAFSPLLIEDKCTGHFKVHNE